jgi:hypothetical protein
VVFAIVGGGFVADAGVGFGTAGASVKAFCRAYLAWETGDLPPWANDVRATAPGQIANTVDFAVTKIREGGQSTGEDPAYWSARAEIEQFLLDECGYKRVDVTMADYRYEGIPVRLKKGVVAFSLRNEGAEWHTFKLGRFKGSLTVDDVLPADALGKNHGQAKQAAPLPPIEEIPGGGDAFPGQSDVVLVDFKKPGKYVAFCVVAVGSTPETMAARRGEEADTDAYVPHYDEGMAVEFTVKK